MVSGRRPSRWGSPSVRRSSHGVTIPDVSQAEPADPTEAGGYEHALPVRYLEVDQQGVVFNAWYLAYLDEAMTGFLHHAGLPYAELQAGGHDVQLVHTELDWRGALRFGDVARVAVRTEAIGRTSFTLAFEVRAQDATPVVTARTVYVCVRLDGSGKTPIPDGLRRALAAA
jgi:acyl-CoA thioester hydrolase